MESTFKISKLSVDDYKKLPEGARLELIEGNLVEEPAPEYGHQDMVTLMVARLRIFADEHHLGKILVAPVDVYLDYENVLQPDILFIANQNLHLIERDGIHGAPDLVIEILSPSNAYNDFTTKFYLYEKYGVKEYFIVDPTRKESVSYLLLNGQFKEISRKTGLIYSEILKMEFHF